MRSITPFILAFAILGCSQQPQPAVPVDTSTVTATSDTRGTTATTPHYAENTPETTRDAHRRAVAFLRAGQFAEACTELDLPLSERRRLTEYLIVLCQTRIPAEALSADDHGDRAVHLDEPPVLLQPQLDALNRHRAWIAAIQDDFAREAAGVVNGFTPPFLPPRLQGSHALAALSAWSDRGRTFDAGTYNATLQRLQSKDPATRLALNALLEGRNLGNVHQLLFADLTGMHVPPPPPMSLPADNEL